MIIPIIVAEICAIAAEAAIAAVVGATVGGAVAKTFKSVEKG